MIHSFALYIMYGGNTAPVALTSITLVIQQPLDKKEINNQNYFLF